VFQTQSAFLGLSEALKDTGVHAYLGQAGNIMTPSILLTAATIVTVEARHAGAIRYQNGKAPTSGPFDTGFTKDQALAVAGPPDRFLIGREAAGGSHNAIEEHALTHAPYISFYDPDGIAWEFYVFDLPQG